MCGYARHRTCSETSLHRQPRDFGHRDWDPQVGLVGWVEFGICWPFKTSFLRGTCRFLLKQDLGVVSQVKSKSKYPRNPLKIGWTITGTYWKKCAIIAGDSVHWRCSMKLSHPNVPLIFHTFQICCLACAGNPHEASGSASEHRSADWCVWQRRGSDSVSAQLTRDFWWDGQMKFF